MAMKPLLEQLNSIGFMDNKRNMDAIRLADGNLDVTIGILTEGYSRDIKYANSTALKSPTRRHGHEIDLE